MEYYHGKHFIMPGGGLNDKIIAPFVFARIAETFGFRYKDEEQSLAHGLKVYPSVLFASNLDLVTPEAVAIHCCAGSWRWMPSGGVSYYVQWVKEVVKNVLFHLRLRRNRIRKILK